MGYSSTDPQHGPRPKAARLLLVGLGLLLLLVGQGGQAQGSQGASWSSTAVLTPDGRRLLVTVPDLGALAIVDTASHTRVGQILVGREPSGVAVSPDGLLAYVANRGANSLSVVDLQSSRTLGEIPVGRQPTAVVVGPQGRRIYVANWASGDVTVLDGQSFEALAALPTGGDPYTLSLSPAGEWLYVGHLWGGRITRVATDTLTVSGDLELGSGAYLLTAILPTADASRAYVLHSRADPSRGATVRGAVEPRLSVIDLVRFRAVRPSFSLAYGDHLPDFPIAAAFGPGQRFLWIAAAGSNDLLAFDPSLNQVVARIQTGANPRAVVGGRDGRLLYVANALDPAVTVVDAAQSQVVLTVPTGVLPLTPAVLEGKRRYYSARLSDTAAGVSCATCHLAGEGDGRVWSFGAGEANTPVLWRVSQTGPWGWQQSWGELTQAAAHARKPPSTTAAATGGAQTTIEPVIASFLATLGGPVDAAARVGGLSLAQQRGKQVFQSAGCGGCHAGATFTDGRAHDVGTGGAFDTPTLLGAATSAPFLHDGRAATLAEAVASHAPSGLSEAQRQDLVAYLMALSHLDGVNGPAPQGSGLRSLLEQILSLLRR